MRIVYLHQHFKTPEMVGGTRSYEMAKRLAAMGHEVHMVAADASATQGNSRRWRQSREAGFRVYWYPAEYSNRLGVAARIRAFVRFAAAASRKAIELNGDVTFATSAPLTIALPALAALSARRSPYVFEVRDLWPETPIAMGALKNPLSKLAARILERTAYRHAATVVALSPDMKRGVVRAGYPESRVSVIPNSCDFDLFAGSPASRASAETFRESRSWLGNRPLIVYTGTLGRVNGVGYLARVAAAAIESYPELRFLVVGDGYERETIEELAKSLGVWRVNFFLEPPVPKRDVPTILAAADIAVSTTIDVPELWANSANKVFDALAAGRPIAINHRGWLADLLLKHGAGLVLPPSDHLAAAQLLSAAANRQWCEHTGRAAQRLGKEMFDRDALASELERVLVAAAGRGAVSETGRPSFNRAA
jgi:glycosyltransferase involved in cell wall biosynthesis